MLFFIVNFHGKLFYFSDFEEFFESTRNSFNSEPFMTWRDDLLRQRMEWKKVNTISDGTTVDDSDSLLPQEFFN